MYVAESTSTEGALQGEQLTLNRGSSLRHGKSSGGSHVRGIDSGYGKQSIGGRKGKSLSKGRDDGGAGDHRSRGSTSDRGSFWQTRGCDDNWDLWPRACYEPLPTHKAQLLRKRMKPITIWTTEIHAGVQRELQALEALLHVPIRLEYRDLWQVIEVARSCDTHGACELPEPSTGLNITKLYYTSVSNAVDIWRNCPRPRELRRQVFEVFTKHPEALAWSGLATADLLYFSAPVVPFELFLPFDLPMIVQAPYGFELGRDLPHPGGEYYWDTVASWKAASKCATRRASPCKTPKMMTSQSPYDVHVMQYITGDVPLRLPGHGQIHSLKYRGADSTTVAVAFGSRDYEHMREHLRALSGRSWPWATASQIFAGIPGADDFDFRELRKPFKLEQLSHLGAIVFIPYKPAVNFFLEIYEMSMPIFVPSPHFYAELDRDFKISVERLWCGGIPPSKASSIVHGPNNTESFEANKYWNSFADHYKYPHVIFFDSWSDLVEKLRVADFRVISKGMQAFNVDRKQHIAKKWLSFMYDVHAAQQDRSFVRWEHWASLAEVSFDAQMKRTYGLKVGRDAAALLKGCNEDFALGRVNLTMFRGNVEPYRLEYGE